MLTLIATSTTSSRATTPCSCAAGHCRSCSTATQPASTCWTPRFVVRRRLSRRATRLPTTAGASVPTNSQPCWSTCHSPAVPALYSQNKEAYWQHLLELCGKSLQKNWRSETTLLGRDETSPTPPVTRLMSPGFLRSQDRWGSFWHCWSAAIIRSHTAT